MSRLVWFKSRWSVKGEMFQQQELIDYWMRFDDLVKGEPGMIGAALHRSTDGRRVVNDAQWRSEEDLDRLRK